MELKRYVSLNGIIFDTNNDNELALFMMVESKNPISMFYTDLAKTSDNILDLVEVGDLVGYRFWADEYEHIEKMGGKKNIEINMKYNNKMYKITSIYKRQPNGDYKRYEVK